MLPRKPFTIPQRLLEARRAGKVTLREMALACGVSIPTVRKELRRQGLTHVRLPRGPKPDTERCRRLAALRAQGLTLQQIGQRLGITPQYVGQLLKPLEGKG